MPSPTNKPRLAVLVSTSNAWGRRLIDGILTYTNEANPWHLWINPHDQEDPASLPGWVKPDCLIARIATPAQARKVEALRVPVFNVGDTPVKGFFAPCVRTDDRAATRMAIDCFAKQGIRDFAITGPLDLPNPKGYARFFQDELARRGQRGSSFSMKPDDGEPTPGLARWLASLPRPTGVLVWGYAYARVVVDTCLEAGLAVPHDIAVLSGDYDELLSRACFPPLSGILGPTEDIGYTAARLLHARMRGEPVPSETVLVPPSRIIEELSTNTLATRDTTLRRVIRHIREHASEPVTTRDLLKVAPMARRSLERRFLHEFGRPISEEIRCVRMDEARRLLAETDQPIRVIAGACGYSSYNYFSKVFKNATHETPAAYRRRHRNVATGRQERR